MARALEGSLRRLGTDRVDLYWMHVWDDFTPAEEVVLGMADLFGAGKVAHWGLSNVPAWFAVQAATLARVHGLPAPIALQLEYSLVSRTIEREHIRAAAELGLGIMPWSPLAGGFLTGKYRRADRPESAGGRLAGDNPFGDSKFTEHNWDVLDVLRDISGELNRSPADIAMAWVAGRDRVDAVLVGARTPRTARQRPERGGPPAARAGPTPARRGGCPRTRQSRRTVHRPDDRDDRRRRQSRPAPAGLNPAGRKPGQAQRNQGPTFRAGQSAEYPAVPDS